MMSAAARTLSVINSWETVRFELLNSRICDLGLQIPGSPVERLVQKVVRELDGKRIRFKPDFYLTDSWGCPNEVPVVGIPFYLADKRLARIEEEQTGDLEDEQTVLMFLRHELGHALNYAYRLWKEPGWPEAFGSFTRPYRDAFQPNPSSREFVRHISHSQYGRNYAQKHPDEDFAETFAVWLTPRSNWRRRYRFWPALRKLRYVDSIMRQIRNRKPRRTDGKLLNPVEALDMPLAEHYGQRTERYRMAAQGYVDDRLRETFPPVKGKTLIPATVLIDRHGGHLVELISRWAELDQNEIRSILAKLRARAEALELVYNKRHQGDKVLELGAMATSLAMDFVYTGRFTG
jgi:hypothetical protein